MPIINFNSIDEVPAELREFAKTDDDTGKVGVNVVPNAKLVEFREKNIDLSKQLEAVSPILDRVKKIAGDDLDSFESDLAGLRDISRRVQDGELKTDDQIENAVQDRIKVIRDGYENNSKAQAKEVNELNGRVATLTERLNRTVIDKEVTAAVLADSGINTTAIPDILQRSYGVFKIEDGKLVAKDGDATIFGANGADSMTPTEWLVKLRDQAPHYFKGNAGGGAAGGKEEKIGGMTAAQIAQLSPLQRLELANKTGGKR